MQTFPDNFIFEGGLMAAGQQVGNAVPVDLAFALIEHIKPLILIAQHVGTRERAPEKRRAA
jgi:DNA (cytosine-5)-methyltransferase 1